MAHQLSNSATSAAIGILKEVAGLGFRVKGFRPWCLHRSDVRPCPYPLPRISSINGTKKRASATEHMTSPITPMVSFTWRMSGMQVAIAKIQTKITAMCLTRLTAIARQLPVSGRDRNVSGRFQSFGSSPPNRKCWSRRIFYMP